MNTPYVERVSYWTRVEGEEDRVRTFARIPDGWEGREEELPEDDEVYYWLDAEEWEESLIGKVFGDALVLRTEEIYEGECDSCGSTYDLSSRWNRCGDCGDCGNCCQHSTEWESVNV